MTTPIDSDIKANLGDRAGTTSVGERGKVKGWPGYVRGGIFVIEKKISGRKYHVSTRATTLRGAMAQLARFEANPDAFSPRGSGDPDALVLDAKLIDDFHEWHRAEVSHQWALNVKNVLVDWANHLKGADLRRLSLIDDLKPHLKTAGQKHHRVKGLRLLFKWLRQERGLVTRAQDVSADLAIPVIRPAQDSGNVKAVSWEAVLELAPHLPLHVRDVLELLAATGWHVAEARRFAAVGSIREKEGGDTADLVAVLGVVHKSGKRHFTALLHDQHLAVARRIRERGALIDNNRLRKHMLRGAELATAARRKIDPKAKAFVPFQLGALRHSVSTWLRQQGVAMRDIAEYVGHESEATTRRHYVDQQVALKVLPRAVLRVVG